MQKEYNNSNHHKKMVKRGKMAAIAGMTLTTGIILSEMTPAVVYADTLHNSHTTESIKVNPNENNEQQSNMSQNSAIISKQNTYSVQQTKTTSQDKCTFNLVGKVLTIHEGLLSGSDLRNYLNQFGKTTKSTITEIIIDSNVTFDEKVPGLFENFKNVTNISGLDTVNTSKTTDMSNMFTNDEKLKTVDINNFDVSHVSTFFKMFYKSSITILNLSKWVPLKLKNNYPFTGSMFDGTTILDISFPSNFNLVDSDIIKDGDTYTESIEDRTISKNINTSNLNQIFSLDAPTKVINLRKNNSMNASTPIPDSTDTKVHATLDGDKIADVKVHVSDIINNLGKTVTVAVPKVSGRFTTNKNVSIKISDTGELIPQGSIAFFDKLTDAAKQNLNAKSSVDNDPKFKVPSVDLTGKTLDTNNNISVDLPPVTGYSTKTKTVTFHVDPETGDVSQLGDPVVFTPIPDSTDTKVHATLDGDKIADVKVHVSDIINNLGKTVTVAVPKVSGRFTTNKNVSIKISDTGELIPQGSIAFFDKLTDAAKQNLNAKSSVDNDPKFKVPSVDLTGKTLDTNNNISVDLPPVTGYSTKTKTVTFHVDPETGDVSQLGDPVVFTPIPDSTDTKVHATLDGDKIADVKVHVSDIINNLGKTVTVAVPKVSGRFTTNKNVSIKISDTGELIPQGSIAFFDKLTDAAKQNLNAKSSVDNDPKFKVPSVDLTGKTLDTNNNISVDLPPVTGYSTKTKTVTFHVDPETGDVSQLGDPVVFTPIPDSTDTKVHATLDGDKIADVKVHVSDIINNLGKTVTVAVPKVSGRFTTNKNVSIKISDTGELIPQGSIAFFDKLTDAAKQNLNAKSSVDNDPKFKVPSVDLTGKTLDTNNNISVDLPPVTGYSTKTKTVTFHVDPETGDVSQLGDPVVFTPMVISDNSSDSSNFYPTDTSTSTLQPIVPKPTTPTHKKSIKSAIRKVSALFKSKFVKLYTGDLKLENREVKAGSDWYSDEQMVVDGVTYYRISTDEWIAADDVYAYDSDPQVVTTKNGKNAELLSALGKISNRSLAPDTKWKSDRVININGKKYFRVSTNEFVSADDVQ